MRDKIVVDEFTAPRADNVGRAGLTAGRPVIEIGADHGDHGNLLTGFRVGRQPVRTVNFGRVWTAFPSSRRIYLDERLLHRQGLMGPVLEHASVRARPVPLHGVPFPNAGVLWASGLVGGSDWPKQPDSGTVSNRTVSISACRMEHGTSGCIINMMPRHNP